MPSKNRKPLGRPLPPVKSISQPTPEQLDEYDHRFDTLVPEWAGLTHPRPEGTPGAKFTRDDMTGAVVRVSDEHVVMFSDRRAAMALLTERMRGK